MNKLFAAFVAAAFAFGSVSAMADDTTAPTPVDQAKLKAERDAARAKWAAMTPEQKAATRKDMQSKRVSELTALEQVAQEGEAGPSGVNPSDTATLKAERDAAKAKWVKMTPEERAATRKAAQSKKVSELPNWKGCRSVSKRSLTAGVLSARGAASPGGERILLTSSPHSARARVRPLDRCASEVDFSGR